MATIYYENVGVQTPDWGTAGIWSTLTVPTSGDDVQIINVVYTGKNNGVFIAGGSSRSANSVLIDNDDWLTVMGGSTLTAVSSITVGTAQGSVLQIDSGGRVDISNGGNLNVGGTANGANGYGELLIGGESRNSTQLKSSGTVGPGTVALNATGSMLVFDTTDSLTFSNDIIGSGSVEQSGVGTTVTLTGSTTYGGTTTVDSGATLVFSNSATVFLSGAVNGTGALEFGGGGLFELVANGSFSGTTTIDAGTSVTIGGSGTSGGISGPVVDNGTLYFFRSDATTVGNLISGSGTVDNYSGTTTLTNANTYTGPTMVGAGTLKAGNSFAFGFNSATSVSSGATLDIAGFSVNIVNLSGAGTVDNSSATAAELSVASINGQSSTFSGVIEGTGAALSLFKGLGGTLTLSGANTYTGTTEVNLGTLVVLNTSTTAPVGVLGKGTITVDANGILSFTNADQTDNGYLINNTIKGAGTVSFQGPDGSNSGTKSSVTTLNVLNSYSGHTTIASGIVNVGSNLAFGTSAVTMTGGAIRATNSAKTLANNFTLSGVIGLGSLTNISGMVTLAAGTAITASENTGADTWSGAVSLGAFTLATSDVGPNRDGATWAGGSLTLSGVVSGNGSVVQGSIGTLVLSGVDLYSGTTAVNEGQLQITGSGSIANSAVTLANATILDISGVTTGTTVGSLTGAGAASFVALGGKSLTVAAASNSTLVDYYGKAGVASNLTIDVASTTFTLATATFSNWVPGTDTIAIVGNAQDNTITGSAQNETITGGAGNDTIIGGGGGADTALYTATFKASTIARNLDGTVKVADAADGTDTLSNIQFAQFTNATVRIRTLADGTDTDGFTAHLVASGQPYSSYDYTYSAAETLISKAFYYTTGASSPFEYDYDGGNHLTRQLFTDVTGQPYSSYEYDYTADLLAGSKFTYTTVPAGATYSSYETDYTAGNAVAGLKFFYTNVMGQIYTGEELDYNANSKLIAVKLTGITSQPYSSLEQDYTPAGAYTGYKAFYTSQAGIGLQEVDVTAAGVLQKIVDTGILNSPYSTLEQDYTGGALSGQKFIFTNVANQPYASYEVDQTAAGAGQLEILNNADGTHTLLGLANGETLPSIGNDTMTGSGKSDTFAFTPLFGHDTITNFAGQLTGASHGTISLPTSEFGSFANLAITQNTAGSAVISASTGDQVTLQGVTKAQILANAGDFKFV